VLRVLETDEVVDAVETVLVLCVLEETLEVEVAVLRVLEADELEVTVETVLVLRVLETDELELVEEALELVLPGEDATLEMLVAVEETTELDELADVTNLAPQTPLETLAPTVLLR